MIDPLKSVTDEDLLQAAGPTAWQLSDFQVECLVRELVKLRGLEQALNDTLYGYSEDQ